MVLAFANRFYQFSGGTHSGCHGGTDMSTTGYVTLNTSNQTVMAGESFTITAQVLLLNEAKGLTVTVGFVSSRGDNSQFGFTPSQYDGVSLDAVSGNSTQKSFTVTAPSTAGNYTLVADALNGANSVGAAGTLNWSTGSLIITVVTSGSTNPPLDIQTIIFIIAGAIGAGLAVVAVVLIKKRS